MVIYSVSLEILVRTPREKQVDPYALEEHWGFRKFSPGCEGAGLGPDSFVLSSTYFAEGCTSLPPEVGGGVGEVRTSISKEIL